jgi:hypothetical protein
MIWTRAFWLAAAERAVATFAQTVVALAGVSAIPAVSAPWWSWFAAGGIAGGLSVLKALAAVAATGDGPSLTSAERITDA